MSETAMGEIHHPQHCRVSASPDRKQLALTFQVPGREPVTIVLPLLGAASMQHRMAQTLHMLGVRPVPPKQSTEQQAALPPAEVAA